MKWRNQKQNSDVLVTSILGTIPSPPCFLPSFTLVKCELIMFPFWLQPQTALISCPGLHLPSTDLCQPLLRCSSLLSNSQMLLGSHLAEEHTLLKSYPFPPQCCLWPLLFFCGPTFTVHMCAMVTKITTGGRMKEPLLSPSGSWTRSGASTSRRDLCTRKGVKYIIEQDT